MICLIGYEPADFTVAIHQEKNKAKYPRTAEVVSFFRIGV